jgi:hypothetical protein
MKNINKATREEYLVFPILNEKNKKKADVLPAFLF